MIQAYPTGFPPQSSPIVDKDGKINTQTGNPFFTALWARTGGGTGITNQAASSLTAEGTTQVDALALMADWNNITIVAAGAGAVLPEIAGGQSVLVQNSGANSLNVYPPDGAEIDALGADAPYVLAPGKMQIFWFFSSDAILSTQLG